MTVSEILAGLIVLAAFYVALRYVWRIVRGERSAGCAACNIQDCPLRDLKNRSCPNTTKR